MRHINRIVFAVALILIIQQSAFGEEPYKIAVIDIQGVIDKSSEGKRISTSLKEKQASLKSRFNEKQKELQDLQKELEKESMMLSLDAQEDKRKEFERKSRELQYLYQDLNEEMNKTDLEARKLFLKDLEGIITAIAKEDDIDMILERRSGGVIYVSGVMDITDKVVAELNKLKP